MIHTIFDIVALLAIFAGMLSITTQSKIKGIVVPIALLVLVIEIILIWTGAI